MMPTADTTTPPYGRVYIIENQVNSKVYIGQTVNPLPVRFRQHRQFAFRQQSQFSIHRAIRRYGIEAFSIREIDIAYSRAELDAKEAEHIRARRSTNPRYGYNLTQGGGGRGEVTPETRAKLSAKQKGKSPTAGRPISPTRLAALLARWRETPRKNKPLTEEHKQKISAALKGRPGNRLGAKMSGAFIAKHTERMRARYAAMSPEERKAENAFLKGIPRTPEVKAKIAETKRRKKMEALAKQSEHDGI